MERDAIKKAVGYKAAELIENGMLVGLGTGSTASYFIERLIERHKEGLQFKAVASSERSSLLAKKGGLALLDPDTISSLDITVDGADEIDPKKRMIKGRGGALVREKILASMSKEFIVIVDESKLVSHLGKAALPLEVVPFAKEATLRHIVKAGYRANFRKDAGGKLYQTDNGNLIVDVHLPAQEIEPEEHHKTLRQIPGVVETGFFFHLAGRIIVGFPDGQVVVKP